MLFANNVGAGGIRDLVKQFCRSQNKDIPILTESHINQDQIHQLRNNCLGPSYLAISQEHCTNQVTITLMTALLPDRVTFIFYSREIVTAPGNRIYLFSFPQESFHFRIVLLIC